METARQIRMTAHTPLVDGDAVTPLPNGEQPLRAEKCIWDASPTLVVEAEGASMPVLAPELTAWWWCLVVPLGGGARGGHSDFG